MGDLRWRRHRALFGLLLIPLLPLVALYLAHRLWLRRKALTDLGAKLTGRGRARTPGAIVVHGVSLGEVQLMRPLVPRLERVSGRACVLTTTSETGAAALKAHFPDHDRRSLPFDLPWAVDRFLSTVRPAAVVLLELEIWPNLILACRQRGIPVLVVNARLSASSFAGYRRAGALLRPVFAGIDLALAQNALWGARLRALGTRTVTVTGSLKADMVSVANDAARNAESRRLGLDMRPLFLVASTSAGEEAPCLTSWRRWGHDHGWRLIICPRHPERGSEIATLCRDHGLAVVQTSRDPLPSADPDSVIIVDEIGRLGPLYGLAELCVVGGSLGSGRGGQNMLEAAAAGTCTVVGDDTRNFPDAMALLQAADGVVESSLSALDATLGDLANDPQRRSQVAAAGQQAWLAGRGALDRVEAALTSHLTPPLESA
ncbi:MAG: 3-deoxy-D-manno-octulosonic acid transferase [Planctomycetota bacterium]